MTVQRRRFLLLTAGLTVWLIIVVARLAQIQLADHDDYVLRATRQQERTVTLTPMRGSIYDSRGRLLAESVTARSIYADPKVITDPEDVAKKLAAVRSLGIDRATLLARLSKRNEFTWIARQVDDETWARVRDLRIQGIDALDEHRRIYPNGAVAGPLLGWVGIDGEGLAGLEHSLNNDVRGRPGVVTVLRDARAGMYFVGGEGANASRDGHDVVLTIDEVVQYIAERALEKAVTTNRAKWGSAIVMDPSNGAVLAMASYPGFDPNHFADYPESSWRNHAVQDIYEPGSTFKIVGASGAIEQGIVTPSQLIDCLNGQLVLAGHTIREHDGERYGLMSLEEILVHSSNVGMARVGMMLGPDSFYGWVRRYGFGTRTGIALPGEASGIVRPPAKWSGLSNAEMAIGQEIGVTPLQMARAFAVIANGGMLVVPRIVDRVVDANGHVVRKVLPREPRRVISERTAAIMNEMLKAVVSRGTGRNAELAEWVVAGKTGTAQKAVRGGYSNTKTIASFGGYVPADRPRVVILVVVEEPQAHQYGGEVAAPAFREIAEATLRYLEVPPAAPRHELDLDPGKLVQLRPRASSRGGASTGAMR